MPPVNPRTEKVTVMGNLFYWTVTADATGGRRYYELDAPPLRQVAAHSIIRKKGCWDRISHLLFPVILNFRHDDTEHIVLHFAFTSLTTLCPNPLAAIAVWLLTTGCRRKRYALACHVLVTGLADLLAAAILPDFRRRNPERRKPKTNRLTNLSDEKTLLFAAALCLLASCGNNARSAMKTSDTAAAPAPAAVTIYEVGDLLREASRLVGKTVTVRGYVTHTCNIRANGASSDDQKTSLRVEAKGCIGGFNREPIDSQLDITGILRENKPSREYLDHMEKGLNEKKIEGDGSADTYKTELAKSTT